jgi:hypothetical protein
MLLHSMKMSLWRQSINGRERLREKLKIFGCAFMLCEKIRNLLVMNFFFFNFQEMDGRYIHIYLVFFYFFKSSRRRNERNVCFFGTFVFVLALVFVKLLIFTAAIALCKTRLIKFIHLHYFRFQL